MSRSLEVSVSVSGSISGTKFQKNGRLLLPLSEKLEGEYLQILEVVLSETSGILVTRGSTQYIFKEASEELLKLLEEKKRIEEQLAAALKKGGDSREG